MASRKSTAAAASANVAELETKAVEAVKGIESSFGAASAAILAFALGAKEAKVTPAVFESGLARIAEAATGVAIVSVRGYISNARRIWQCDAGKLAEITKMTNGLQSIAKACPTVSKNGGAGVSKAKEKTDDAPVDPKAPSAPVVKEASADPMAMMANALLMLRKLANGKKKARIILAAVGEIEDMIDELKSLMTA